MTILKLPLALAACAISLALSIDAIAVPISTTSDQYVGSISPNVPANEAAEVSYINALIALAPGASGNFSGQTLVRSSETFVGGLPTAVVTGSFKDETNPSTTIDITGFEYLLGKYGGQGNSGGGAWVFFVGDLTGEVTIPGNFGTGGPGLSHYTLYNANRTSVPDGGATVMLLGMALGGAGALRRRFGK